MKAFVTGGTGFLGTHIVRKLSQDGWDILALHRERSNLKELNKLKNITFLKGDILDIQSLKATMPSGIDAVFHVAGSVGNLPHKEESSRYSINQKGTENVVNVCLEKNIGRLIYTSTVVTYDYRKGPRVDESFPMNMWCLDPYIHSKRLAEQEAIKGLEKGLDVVFMHPSAVFGSFDRDSWSRMFSEIQRGLPLPVAPPGGGTICDARAVAAAHVAAFKDGKKGEHFILGGVDTNWLQVAQEIAGILQRPKPIFSPPELLFKAYGWTEFFISNLIGRSPMLTPHTIFILCEKIYCDSRKAESILNYKSPTMKEMLLDCYNWMVEEKMLPSLKLLG